MATTSTGLSSPGVGSGLDVNSIVTQLVSLERRPISALQTTAARLQTEISGIGQLQSLTSAFKDAASALADPAVYSRVIATSSDSTVMAATASGTPLAGTYSIETVAQSSTQTTASAAGDYLSSSELAGAGTLTLSTGLWASDMASFTPKTGQTSTSIEIFATDTLANVRDKINAANAGVSAAIVTDTTGARLTLRGTSTGAESGFRLSVVDADGQVTDASGLSRLAFDPPGGASRTQRTMAASDAVAKINGVEVSSSTDTFDGAIEGLSLKLGKAPASNVTLTVGANSDSVKQLLSKFVAAYNALAKFLSTQTRYDASTGQAGVFQGDSGVLGVSNQLRSLTGSRSMASPTFQGMSSLGIEMLKDGTLQINSSRLETALKNLPELAAALSRDVASQPLLTGSMVKFKSWADGLMQSTGALPGRTQSLKARLTANAKQQAQLEDRVAAVEKRLRAQYSALDTKMSRATALSSYVSQQMTAIQNANSNS